MTKRKVYGFGINDANYHVAPIINGKQDLCPYYSKWSGMLKRCYDPHEHARYPKYADCTVCEEWRYFSVFKSWMETQEWEGKFLDKDIRVPGNKHYSPETCLFVTPAVNGLLADTGAIRGPYPQGVTIKDNGKYASRLNMFGVREYLGQYNTPEDAYRVYCAAKSAHLKRIALQQTGRLKRALLRHSLIFQHSEVQA